MNLATFILFGVLLTGDLLLLWGIWQAKRELDGMKRDFENQIREFEGQVREFEDTL